MAAPVSYWEDRARRFASSGWGLRAVCSYGMPPFYNGYIHFVQQRALAKWLRMPPGTTVLDVGCGVGRWSRRLARLGAKVTGIDLAPAMVAEAARRAAAQRLDTNCKFLVADVQDLQLGRQFERIVCVTVLQHIVSPEPLQRAIDRMCAHLAPGGRLVVLEAAPSTALTRCDSATFVGRDEDTYREAFGRAGLRCVAVAGVDPLPLKTRFLPLYANLPGPVAWCGLLGVTLAALPFDLIAGRWLSRLSWHKIFVLQSATDEQPDFERAAACRA